MITFMNRDQELCRITNKSSQPIELSLWVDKQLYRFDLPPITNKFKIDSFENDQPFNNDYIMFSFHHDDKKRLVAKGIDIISNTKYHFLFFKKDGEWRIKQYKILHIGNFTI